MTGSKSQDIASGDVTWGLCGLIRTALFNSQVRAISYTYIILFVCLLLLVILSLPLIKLWYMGSREKLRIADVLILTITAILGTATLTFLLLDQKEYSRLSQVMDKQLELFADEIEKNLLDELTQAYKQLKTFAQQEAIPKDNKGYKTVPNCLSEMESSTRAYPYFDILALIDSSGEQRVKWSPKSQTTPLIDVSERGYVRYVREKRFWTIADTMQVVLEPIFSWNTGENLVTLSIPQDSTDAVAAMSFRLLSLLKTVVPKGFGFSIIQKDGKVLFHSDENRNLRENFFDECDDNQELKSAVFAHARKSLNAQYRGRGHRLHVTPLANSQWFLIVFRDKKILRTANLEIFVESLMLFLLYVLSFLLLLSLVYILRSGYRPEWLWPQRTKTVAYRQLIFAYLLVSAIFLVWIFAFSAYQILHTVFLLPPFAIGLAYLKLQHRSKKSTRKRRLTYAGLAAILIILLGFAIWLSNDPFSAALKCLGLIAGLLAAAALLFHSKISELFSKLTFPSFREGFVLAMVSLLVLISIIPAVAFYKFAFDEELELLIKHGQLNLSQALDEQKARVTKEFRDIVVSDRESLLKNRLALHWGVYDTLFFDTSIEEAVQDDCLLHSEEPRRSLFKEFLMKLRPLRSQIAEETRGLIHEASADSGWAWKPVANNRLVLHKETRSEKSARHLSSMLPDFASHKSFLWWFGLAFILMLIYPLTRYIAKRLFLINLEEPTDLYHEELKTGKITKNLLVLGPPNAGKSKLLKGKPGMHIIDLAKKDSPEDVAKETQFKSKPIVAVDHLEYQIEDANWNHAKFELIRKLLYVHKKTVVVFSTIDPMFYFSNTEQAGNQSRDSEREALADSDRWAVVFSAFLKVYYEEQGDEKKFSQTMDTSVHRKKLTDERLLNLYRILQRECKPSANLKRIGLAIAELEEFNHLTEEELLGQFLEWAEAYYRAIWATCSKEEKMILNHIARYGFVNSRNHEIVRRLLRRRLVYRDPAFRLMNETFRRFVRSPQIQQEISTWEEQVEASSWSKMKVPVFTVLAAVVVFIFTTQQEVFDTTLTMLSALAAALPALIRLFGFVPIRKTDGDTPQSQTA
ncbi:hypothetical protein GWN75_02865 [candidate division KSB1 bacterium]|nr:hypothetical protein [candidate division KSB1 bacterium]NIS23000.1 hypothetical protein [candidate division KSB1 bacterium]NIU23507.1 hypothetical protein [candidate division KSB1 bacterium]NIW17351.1 hypothetical protein [candidate division KSB1 bacterium]